MLNNSIPPTKRVPLLLIALLYAVVLPLSQAATSISQFGITWTFDRDYRTGRFANGDYWVVGPVTIKSISPKTVRLGGATLHGSMVNPEVNAPQSYDSRIKHNAFSEEGNVAAHMPLQLEAGTSLLSSESYWETAGGDRPQLKTIAILTVLSAPAPEGSFRPPYLGNDKRLRWNKNQLQYDKLRSLHRVPATPSLESVEASFKRPWIEQKTDWTGRYLHPGENQPGYGREIAHTLADGLLSLQLDYPNSRKEKLLIRLVQYGIDIYGAARLGAIWPAGGGHNHGRKMPLMLAGVTLGDPEILSYADGSKLRFQEDRQTWYVTNDDVGRPLYSKDRRPRDPYLTSDVGIPEWGEKHYPEPKWDGRNWQSFYRTVVGASIMGHVLTARLMGLQDTWNWPPLFDYADRYWTVECGRAGGGSNSISKFVAQMWTAYRGTSFQPFSEKNVATDIWEDTEFKAQSGVFDISFDLSASRDKVDGVTGLSAGEANGIEDLVACVRLAPNGLIEANNGEAFGAANPCRYTAGEKLRVNMTVNTASRTYSATVARMNGPTVVIASHWRFRPRTTGNKPLDRLSFRSTQGYHAVQNVHIQQSLPHVSAVKTAPFADYGSDL